MNGTPRKLLLRQVRRMYLITVVAFLVTVVTFLAALVASLFS